MPAPAGAAVPPSPPVALAGGHSARHSLGTDGDRDAKGCLLASISNKKLKSQSEHLTFWDETETFEYH